MNGNTAISSGYAHDPVNEERNGILRTLIIATLALTFIGTASAMTLETYRERMHNQHEWTQRAQENRCRAKTPWSEFTKTPLRSVLPAWRGHHVVWAKARHERAQARSSACLPSTTAGIIRYVFGAYGDQAVAVAQCESGLSVYAENGQYLGLFQMGAYARARYGHSWTALGQSRSAYAYFKDSGSDWSPWQCRPYGLAW